MRSSGLLLQWVQGNKVNCKNSIDNLNKPMFFVLSVISKVKLLNYHNDITKA